MNWTNYLTQLQSKIESYLQKDKLEHFFVMSLLVLPVSLIWHSWWLTLLTAAFGATAKEYVDVQYRGKQWDWLDWLYGIYAGLLQSLILI